MKKIGINFLLLAVAVLLFRYTFWLGVIWTLGYSIRLRSFRKIIGYLSESALSVALVIDLLGNVVMRDLLNWACIAGEGRYSFGTYTETISEVLGHNKQRGTLRRAGRWLADGLNFIDKDHVERAAGYLTNKADQPVNYQNRARFAVTSMPQAE